MGRQSPGQDEAPCCGVECLVGSQWWFLLAVGRVPGKQSCSDWGTWAENGQQSQGKGQSYREGRNWSDLLPWMI